MINIRFNQIRMLFWLSLFSIVSFFWRPNVWLLSERGDEARDNGYSFYEYLKKSHPQQKVRFLITKKSSDYSKVKEDAVFFNSVKSFYYICISKRIISAHYASVLKLPDGAKIFRIFKLYKKFCFLQHGITKDDLEILYYKNSPMRLFICGALPEYNFIKSQFGHPDGVVCYTGFARYDNLYECTRKKQILIMPTWRRSIKCEKDFLDSRWFNHWSRLLNNADLLNDVKKEKIKIIFYAHYELQKYIKLMNIKSSSLLEVATIEKNDIQQLIKESSLLITDYSSVFFDFAYMNKPVLYYQFDKYHYKKGYFDYSTMGFGEICNDEDSLLDNIKTIIDNDFKIDEFYKKRAQSFFYIKDSNNCDRIYNEIIKTYEEDVRWG